MTTVLENNIFQNQQVPKSVVLLTKIMPDISESVLNPILKLILDVVRKKPILPKASEKLFKKFELTENGDHLFSGLLMLIQALLRLPLNSLKDTDLKQSLKELKFSDECSNEFIAVLKENKSDLFNRKIQLGNDYFCKLDMFSWRIDITISSNYLAKSLDTVIIFQIFLKSGDTKTFEVNVAKFHQLRFYVSSLLKELEFIDNKNVFKT